jgi:hypothetical protein
MTWAEFNTAVRVHLTTHNRRQGIQTHIDTLIKAGVGDLQSAVVSLRTGHSTGYPPSDFTADGYAGLATCPAGHVISRAYARDVGDTVPLYDFDIVNSLTDERNMVSGDVADGVALIAIRSNRGEFRVVPNPQEYGAEVVLVSNGKKTDFADADAVPVSWDESVVQATADFVLARLSRTVGDLDLADSYSRSYLVGKRRIKSDRNEADLPGPQVKRA